MIGKVLGGKYDVVRLLGEGGMGAVYEAVHTGTGRRVALKVIRAGEHARDPELVGRFEREARAAGAIDTQHIVQVFDTGRDADTGCPYLVMEMLAGSDLAGLLARVGPLPPDLALKIVAQAALGLAKAHEAGVVHRDIKPENLFLSRRDGTDIVVKVLDFGIAKVKMDHATGGAHRGLTRTGSILGSPSYMSPEQAQGLRGIDHRTDVWSLGAVLYEALSGRTPHEHVETIGQLIIAICAAPPPPLRGFAPWVPEGATAVVDRALQLDPAARYATIEAMLADIRALVANLRIDESMFVPLAEELRATAPLPAKTLGRTSLGGTAFAPTISAPSITLSGAQRAGASATDAPRRRRRRAVGAVAGAVALSLSLAVGYRMWLAGNARVVPVPPVDAAAASVPTEEAAPSAVSSAMPLPTPRTVVLTVAPEEAKVEIDGVEIESQGGVVRLIGALGSSHSVRAMLGARSIAATVVIAEHGAVPPRIELGPATPGPRHAAQAPVGSAPTIPKSAPVPPVGSSTLDRKFE